MELFQHTRAGGGLPPKVQRSATSGDNNAVSATAGSVYIVWNYSNIQGQVVDYLRKRKEVLHMGAIMQCQLLLAVCT